MAILTVVDAHNEIARAAEVGGDEAIDILDGVEDTIHNWLMSEEEKRALIGVVHAMHELIGRVEWSSEGSWEV